MNRQHDAALPGAKGAGTSPNRGTVQEPKAVLSVLAAAGLFAPIVFTVGFVVQGFLRTDLRLGYNPIAQEISDLTAGPDGWVQQVNFVVFGLLLIAFAVGLRRGVRKASPWMVGPALVAWNGVELMVAGFFPRSEDATGHIYDPLGVHMINGMLFFLSIGVVLIVLSLRFARDERWRDLATYTRVSGITLGVLVVLNGFFAEAPSDSLHPWLGLFQRAILAVWFLCLVMLALRLCRVGVRDAGMAAPSSASSIHVKSGRSLSPTIPRWVIVFGIMILLLLLVVVTIEITSGGMGDMHMSVPRQLPTIAYGGQEL